MTWIVAILSIFIGWAVWSIRSAIQSQLAAFCVDLMEKLDNRFVSQRVYDAEMKAMADDVADVDHRVATIERHIFQPKSSAP